MSAPTNPLLLDCDPEQELPVQPSSQEVSSRRGRFGYKPSNDSSMVRASRDAFDDPKYIGKKRKDGWQLDWSFIRPVLLAICWNLFVQSLLGYLCVIGFSGNEQNLCQPDGEFRLDGEDQLGGFNWWAPRVSFRLHLAGAGLVLALRSSLMLFGTWLLVEGSNSHGFCIMPASYSTVWLIKIQKDNSALATWRLASGFFRVGLASKKVMCFIIWTLLFILIFPTFAGSMTGYTPYNKAYANSTSERLVQFSEIFPVAYLIKDGDRVDGLSKNYPVLLIVACSLGSTYRQRIPTLFAALVLCVPFLFYNAIDRDLVLPGFGLGALLTFFLGSSRGSHTVLFVVPLLWNYIVVFGLFTPLAVYMSSSYDHYYLE